MPQAGIDPPRHSRATYEASALPPSHHGWILTALSNKKAKSYYLAIAQFQTCLVFYISDSYSRGLHHIELERQKLTFIKTSSYLE